MDRAPKCPQSFIPPETPALAAPGPPRPSPLSLLEVEQGDPVAHGAEQGVAIAGEAEVAAAVHGAQQAGELRGQERAGLEGLRRWGSGEEDGEMVLGIGGCPPARAHPVREAHGSHTWGARPRNCGTQGRERGEGKEGSREGGTGEERGRRKGKGRAALCAFPQPRTTLCALPQPPACCPPQPLRALPSTRQEPGKLWFSLVNILRCLYFLV